MRAEPWTAAPLGLAEVEITGGPWAERQRVNAGATLAHCQDWMERLGWVGNFDDVLAADTHGRPPGPHQGMVFADSDVYKLMEAMAWEVGRSRIGRRRPALRRPDRHDRRRRRSPTATSTPCSGGPASRRDTATSNGATSCTTTGTSCRPPSPAPARPGATSSSTIARRVADHVCDTFADGGIERVGGHPEIELGLVELARETGEQRYLAQASTFIRRRGTGTLGEIPFGQAYFQDDMPIRAATVLRGHAVRALYLTAGAVDVAVETGDDELLGV